MENRERLTKAFNQVCQGEPETFKRDVSNRLKEYIEDWSDDASELGVAVETYNYYQQKPSPPTPEDEIEVAMARILISALSKRSV